MDRGACSEIYSPRSTSHGPRRVPLRLTSACASAACGPEAGKLLRRLNLSRRSTDRLSTRRQVACLHGREKGTGTFCGNGHDQPPLVPGASHKRCLSPFPAHWNQVGTLRANRVMLEARPSAGCQTCGGPSYWIAPATRDWGLGIAAWVPCPRSRGHAPLPTLPWHRKRGHGTHKRCMASQAWPRHPRFTTLFPNARCVGRPAPNEHVGNFRALPLRVGCVIL